MKPGKHGVSAAIVKLHVASRESDKLPVIHSTSHISGQYRPLCVRLNAADMCVQTSRLACKILACQPTGGHPVEGGHVMQSITSRMEWQSVTLSIARPFRQFRRRKMKLLDQNLNQQLNSPHVRPRKSLNEKVHELHNFL